MSTTGHELEVVNVQGLKASMKKSGNYAILNDCICSTAGATAAKVTNTVPPSFSLVNKAKILVKFTYGINVANATLQVGENAAKPIYYRGAALEPGLVKAGDSLLLRYNGTQWDVVGVLDQDLSGKADVSSTVSNVSYDSATGKLRQTINGQTTDITDVVKSGFVPTFNSETGIMTMTPKGAATIAPDAQTGLIQMTF